jgi:Glycogen recognition site of AMP-activated protein kinase
MKTYLQNRARPSAQLRILARVEELAAFQAVALSPTPFADLMLHPNKLEAVLKKLENGKPRAEFSPTAANGEARKNMPSGKRQTAGKTLVGPLKGLKNTEFQLKAPGARSVKLAADFTDWEKSPLDLIRSEDGVWFTVVPLLPGSYAYRFLVDGQWHEDPPPAHCKANTLGPGNTVINVT